MRNTVLKDYDVSLSFNVGGVVLISQLPSPRSASYSIAGLSGTLEGRESRGIIEGQQTRDEGCFYV